MFASDNTAPVHPAILAAIAEANVGHAPSYAVDAWTEAAVRQVREAVAHPNAAVLFVASGTVANAIALAALTPPWGAVLCHRHAHIAEDEAGAPEFFTGGAKLLLIDGPSGKLSPEALDREAGKYSRAWVHGAQPFAVSITQASECGAAYRPDEVAALSAVCRARGLKLHMDGARFANAVVSTGATPADLTWRAGVDILSFGATKNGALAAEAIVCFDPAAAEALPHLRKRAGAMLSKHRFLGAQMGAYLRDGLWLSLAAHANAMAAELAEVFAAAGCALAHPVEANEVFVRLTPSQVEALKAAGAQFYAWETDGPDVHRFVTSWVTQAEEIAAVRTALAKP